jgi:carbonic anhydrase/acetyltransferase-like protein (isoleucine patch superfamily)
VSGLKHELAEYRREPAKRVALGARFARPLRVRRFHSFGEGSILDRPDWLYGPWKIAIGSRVLILRGAWLAVERSAWPGADPVLRIGDGVAMRPRCAISASASITIEDAVVFGTGVSVIDSDHTHVPNDNVLYNPAVCAPIRIGRGTWLGDRVVVLKGADIGEHCTIGAGSVVRGTIPDHSVAVGAPARVVGSTR